jgi:hypothetical protein
LIRAAAVASLTLALGASAAYAAPPGPHDPNWPCQQIKVPEMSLAAVWSGPSMDLGHSAWTDDPAAAELVSQVTPRRTPVEQAQTLIAGYAERAGDQKQPALLKLLAGVFATLSNERASIMAGLDRFGARQKELAATIRADNEKLRALQTNSQSSPDDVQKLTQHVTWEAELFQDRRQALSYACDAPGKVEQRLFALARIIRHELE